ncbi:hypothetical protein B0T14DRAFT_564013 [Immersiella caudata]|uniref:RING-type domain-containing protein n=1 Tax=Immersiella caudata TaxID=314043 RepID=A0AA40C338_9PEZI|nr:hypothetical protein B0T14DRAFT_564013 [Immersiella caudata]
MAANPSLTGTPSGSGTHRFLTISPIGDDMLEDYREESHAEDDLSDAMSEAHDVEVEALLASNLHEANAGHAAVGNVPPSPAAPPSVPGAEPTESVALTNITETEYMEIVHFYLSSHPIRLRPLPTTQFESAQSGHLMIVDGNAIRDIDSAPLTSTPAPLDDSPDRNDKMSYWPAVEAYLTHPTGAPPIIECIICWKDLEVHGIPPRTPGDLDPPSGRGVALPCGHLLCNECMETHTHTPLGDAPPTTYVAESVMRHFPHQLRADENLVQHSHPQFNYATKPTSITLLPALQEILIQIVAAALNGNFTAQFSPPRLERFFQSQPPTAKRCPSCSHAINFAGCWHTTRGVPLPFDCPSEDLVPCARIPPVGSPVPHVCDACALLRLRLWISAAVDDALWNARSGKRMTVGGKDGEGVSAKLRQAIDDFVCVEWGKEDLTRTSWGRWMYYHGKFLKEELS